ncbi:MAG: adenylate kinase [Alistipes sp.]|jgi:adenylate kinase|nr:adenylate kinase [Alistipes sp.]
MINIVLFGAPGAGKGTQATRLAQKYNLNHISTGDIIRAEIRGETPLGLKVKEAISRGELAPDQVVIEIIENYVRTHRDVDGNIFDGFPRTTPQAEAFDEILAGNGLRIDMMLELVVPEEELVKRILLRGAESGRADDADENVIRNRIDVYNAQTAPVAEYYRTQGKYTAIPGSGPVDDIFAGLCVEIDKIDKI